MEMLIVLLIVSLLNFGLYTKMNTSLYVFMKQVQTLCITAQEKAYVENRKVSIDINEKMVVDEKNYFMPKDTFNKLGYKAKINTHTTSYIN